jgi:hypothetical protein
MLKLYTGLHSFANANNERAQDNGPYNNYDTFSRRDLSRDESYTVDRVADPDPIGSRFNRVSGSGSVFRNRIQEGKNDPQK